MLQRLAFIDVAKGIRMFAKLVVSVVVESVWLPVGVLCVEPKPLCISGCGELARTKDGERVDAAKFLSGHPSL